MLFLFILFSVFLWLDKIVFSGLKENENLILENIFLYLKLINCYGFPFGNFTNIFSPIIELLRNILFLQ